jgi:hypothetical protein
MLMVSYILGTRFHKPLCMSILRLQNTNSFTCRDKNKNRGSISPAFECQRAPQIQINHPSGTHVLRFPLVSNPLNTPVYSSWSAELPSE